MIDDPEANNLIGPAANGPRRRKNMGPFQDLLLKAAPVDESGSASIYTLAHELNITAWSIYKWMKKNDGKGQISPHWAREVVRVSKGRVSFQDFFDFI
jgi:hypothetical protein